MNAALEVKTEPDIKARGHTLPFPMPLLGRSQAALGVPSSME